MMETRAIKVEGMSCSHCENAVRKAVGGLPGVESVTVDLKGKSVTVVFDNGIVSREQIREAIEDQGYDVV